MKVSLSVLLSFLICCAATGQSLPDADQDKPTHKYCVTEEIHHNLLKSDSDYALRSKKTEDLIRYRYAQRTEGTTPIYTIPVVVHIIHNNGPENISDQQVMDGIQHLNDAFRHRSHYDGEGGADIGIEFCLSLQDTSGNSTTGINRIQSTLTQYNVYADEQAMKGSTSWDSKRYLNIWIVREICLQTECRINGYSTFPYNHGLLRDGIVVLAQRFGTSPIDSKIHIHEVGHYFDLYHTFGSCNNDDCLLNGDYVCDTPPDQSGDEIPCGTFINSCTSDENDLSLNNPFRPLAYGGLGDQNDMTQNYMDYGNLDCMNLFTEGQKARMIAALLDVRSSLLLSNGCKPPCTPPLVSFSASALSIDAGNTLSFTNTSTSATHFKWEINDNEFSKGTNATYAFNVPGNYNLKLLAYNGDSSCVDSASVQVKIIQPTSDYTLIPNLITANGDGYNDSFQIVGLTPGFTLELYNQWDALVYKKENYDNTFDAQGIKSGIYFFNLLHPQTSKTYRGWLQIVKE